jgi:hypothetical protein
MMMLAGDDDDDDWKNGGMDKAFNFIILSAEHSLRAFPFI